MNYRTKNRLGLAVIAFVALVIVLVAAKSDAIGTATSTLEHLHAQ